MTEQVEGWCFDCEAPLTQECIDGEHSHQLAVTQAEYEAMYGKAEGE
jgi:hypothetical protein